MKALKIAFVAVALALMTGCAGGGYNSGYQQRQVEVKCKQSANRNATNAYIRKESTVRFADNRAEAQKAQQVFNKKITSIETTYNKCLNNGYQRLYENNLRKQMTYKW